MRLIWPWQAQGTALSPQNRTRLALVAVVLVLAAVGAFAAIIAVSRSSSALPGDGLYGVKLFNERVDLAFTLSDTEKANKYINLVNLRIFEIVTLATENRYENIPAGVDALSAEIDDSANAFRAVTDHNQNQGLGYVLLEQQNLNSSAQLLSTLALAGPPVAQSILRSAVEALVSGQGVLRAQLPDAARTALDQAGPAPTLPSVAITALALPTGTPGATASALLPGTSTAVSSLTASPTATNSPIPTSTATFWSPPSATPPPAVASTTNTPAPGQNPPPSSTPVPPGATTGAPPTHTAAPSQTSPPPSATSSAVPPSQTAQPTPTNTSILPLPTLPLPTVLPTHTREPTHTPPPTGTPRPTDPPPPTHAPKPTHEKNATNPASPGTSGASDPVGAWLLALTGALVTLAAALKLTRL